ncbi:unnamed protein product [marine sediment metagenome]|uniref:Uncharacterized protein n=1 Tax=marine sediment metagenome TaxID=412755 RepID=X0U2Q1_9ZZZZ
MFPDIRPGTTNNAAGWTCAICNAWVPVNTYHACGGSPTVEDAPITFDFTAGDTRDDTVLHAKLDEILRLLKLLT